MLHHVTVLSHTHPAFFVVQSISTTRMQAMRVAH